VTLVDHLVGVWLVGTVICGFATSAMIRDARDADKIVLARLALTCWAWPLWVLAAGVRGMWWLWKTADFSSLRLRR
jgi:hypothetical protein